MGGMKIMSEPRKMMRVYWSVGEGHTHVRIFTGNAVSECTSTDGLTLSKEVTSFVLAIGLSLE